MTIESSESFHWLINRFYLRRDEEKAQKLIKRLLTVKKSIDLSEATIEYIHDMQVKLARQRGEFSKAIQEFNLVSSRKSFTWISLKQSARCLYLQGKFKMSFQKYLEILERAGDDWEIYHCLGLCLKASRDFRGAMMWFEKAIRIQNHPKTLEAIAETQQDLEESYPILIDSLTNLSDFVPTDSNIFNRKALLMFRNGDLGNSMIEYAKSLSCDQTSNVNGLMGSAASLYSLHDFKGALTKYALILSNKSDNNYDPLLWNNIGASWYSLSKLILSICSLKKALFMDPLNCYIHYNLGLAYYRGEQFCMAYHHFSACISLDQDNNCLFAKLGLILTLDALGKAESASDIADSMEINNASYEIHYWLSLFYSSNCNNQVRRKKHQKLYQEIKSKANEIEMGDMQLNELITWNTLLP